MKEKWERRRKYRWSSSGWVCSEGAELLNREMSDEDCYPTKNKAGLTASADAVKTAPD